LYNSNAWCVYRNLIEIWMSAKKSYDDIVIRNVAGVCQYVFVHNHLKFIKIKTCLGQIQIIFYIEDSKKSKCSIRTVKFMLLSLMPSSIITYFWRHVINTWLYYSDQYSVKIKLYIFINKYNIGMKGDSFKTINGYSIEFIELYNNTST